MVTHDFVSTNGIRIIIDDKYIQCSPEEHKKRLDRFHRACIGILEDAAAAKEKHRKQSDAS